VECSPHALGRSLTFPGQNYSSASACNVQRFFYDEISGERVILAERLCTIVGPCVRRINSLDRWFTFVSFIFGGEAGARLLEDLGATTSGDTLLKHIRSLNLDGIATLRVLSVDAPSPSSTGAATAPYRWTSSVTGWWTSCRTAAA